MTVSDFSLCVCGVCTSFLLFLLLLLTFPLYNEYRDRDQNLPLVLGHSFFFINKDFWGFTPMLVLSGVVS